jgi:hypothetical protein
LTTVWTNLGPARVRSGEAAYLAFIVFYLVCVAVTRAMVPGRRPSRPEPPGHDADSRGPGPNGGGSVTNRGRTVMQLSSGRQAAEK